MRSRRATCTGWGRFPVEVCDVFRPEKRADVALILATGGHATYIPRGLGRSYGDASLNRDGAVITHVRLDRLLAFDSREAVLECEAGVTLDDIMRTFLPRGYSLHVTPGTRHVTVGGAIASDVHGKNHHADGSFTESIIDFSLQLASGESRTCSRTENSGLFWATVGGMGLTGAILSARLRLRRVEAAYVRADYLKTKDLDEALDRFEATDRRYRYSVAWIDCLASGRSLGRSVVMQANDAGGEEVRSAIGVLDPLRQPSRRELAIGIDFPAAVLSRPLVRSFNAIYYRSQRSGTGRIVGYDRFFFPLDSVRHWNRAYGARGLLQYQGVFPRGDGASGLRAVLEQLSKAGRPSFLAVLKRFGKGNDGVLSFPMEGYTLALDLPNGSGDRDLVRRLYSLTAAHGGRVYLAKDALLEPETFAAMYPRAAEFRAVREVVDAEGRFSSSLARRIGLD